MAKRALSDHAIARIQEELAKFAATPQLDLLRARKIISKDPRVLLLTPEEYKRVVMECAEELDKLPPDVASFRIVLEEAWRKKELSDRMKAKEASRQAMMLEHLGPSPGKRSIDLFWANRRATIRKRVLAGEKVADVAREIGQSPASIRLMLRKEERIARNAARCRFASVVKRLDEINKARCPWPSTG